MKATIEKAALLDAVGWAARSLPSRPSVPVLAGLKLTAAGDALTVEGFDYEVSSQTSVTATVAEPGVTLVSGRLLAEIAKALPNKPVQLSTVGASVELTCGSARFTLPTMPVEDYPTLPDLPATVGTVDAAAFVGAVAQVAIAAGRDESLPMMTGVRVELSGNTLALLATDRYRLALREIVWDAADPDATANALIPAKTLMEAAKQLGNGGPVTVSLSGDPMQGLVGFSAGGKRTTSRLLDGANYPPVRTLFPEPDKITRTALVNVAALREVVGRVALVAERTTPVRLSFTADGLTVEAGGTEDARASERMDVASFVGEPLTIAFNPQYLLDGLIALGTPAAHIAFMDGFKPAVLSPADGDGKPTDSYRYLIMPIRVAR